eukprot:CAMPEP_0183733428 /NCGR_PEP_ID=MMETSP0737-20130205/41141_1 /TAXON_ID=385413 /ORGANISM="Thalassiosira miniscula, Strain CCMP1093" /LENGTH=527 /DNA_ID=CAMNT_0025966679 /DNA_START=74 /DNA_END=1654 /DNA_ORIENTATION=-
MSGIRMPKKLGKKSMRDLGGLDNDEISHRSSSSPSVGSRKFPSISKKSSASSSDHGGKKSSLGNDRNGASGSSDGGPGRSLSTGTDTMSSSSNGRRPTLTRSSNPMAKKPQPFETSEGAMRLNRILDSSSHLQSDGASKPVLEKRGSFTSADVRKGVGSSHHHPASSSPGTSSKALAANSGAASGAAAVAAARTKKQTDYIPPSTIQLADPTDEGAVGEMTCRISSKMRVDARSIGGRMLSNDGKVEARTGNVLLREGWEEMMENKNNGDTAATAKDNEENDNVAERKPSTPLLRPMNRLTNECLFSMCVSQFDLSVGSSGGPSGGKKRHIPIAKSRNKLRYVVVVRSTNRPLLRPRGLGADGSGAKLLGDMMADDDVDDEMEDDDDLGSDDGYDNMYNPDPNEEAVVSMASASTEATKAASKKVVPGLKGKRRLTVDSRTDSVTNILGKGAKRSGKKLYDEYDCGIPSEREISSFPALFCLAIHADGTKPDVRKILELDKLVSIENAPPRKNAPPGSAGYVVLVFR